MKINLLIFIHFSNFIGFMFNESRTPPEQGPMLIRHVCVPSGPYLSSPRAISATWRMFYLHTIYLGGSKVGQRDKAFLLMGILKLEDQAVL